MNIKNSKFIETISEGEEDEQDEEQEIEMKQTDLKMSAFKTV